MQWMVVFAVFSMSEKLEEAHIRELVSIPTFFLLLVPNVGSAPS